MTRATLFKHFDSLADTPEAVAKLRALTLDLAVRGRLVPQSTKTSTNAAWQHYCRDPGSNSPSLFEVPSGWRWVKLDRVAEPCGQKKPDKRFSYVDVGAIDNVRGVITADVQVLDADAAPSRARKLVQSGSVIYSTVRPYLRNIAVVDRNFDPPAIVSTAFAVLHPKPFLDPRFLFHWLRSGPFQDEVAAKMKGVAYPAISDSEFWERPIPVPPPEEQKRIVAKVEELLGLCDALEARQKAAREHRARVVHSALGHLTAAQDEAEFRKHAHFILHRSPFILEDVPALRQTILSLAVQGRLVPRRGKEIAVASERSTEAIEAPIQCPTHWRWVRLETLLAFGPTNGLSPKPVSFPTKTRALTLTATTSGTFRADYFKYIEQEIEPDSDLWLRAGDILLQRGNSLDYVGIAAVYEGADGQFIYPDLMIKIRVGNSVNPRFAHLVLNSPFGRDFFRSRATGTSGSMPKINQGVIRGFPFPVVQLAEQHRIVAKVEELMRWCDQLEVHLATARTTATHLLDATLNQILERAA